MKKVILCAVICCMAGFMSSCNKDEEKCWKVIVKDKDSSSSAEFFLYGTIDEVKTIVAADNFDNALKVQYQSVNKSESECHDNQCWKVTVTVILGNNTTATAENFFWGTIDDVKTIMAESEEIYGRAIKVQYQPVDKSESECEDAYDNWFVTK